MVSFLIKRLISTLIKNFSSENTPCYISQGGLSTVKGGELAIYNHNFILGQLVVGAN